MTEYFKCHKKGMTSQFSKESQLMTGQIVPKRDYRSENEFYYYRITAKQSENEAFNWDRRYQQMRGGRDF